MTRILITGMSGAGKSTLLAALALRGHETVDTDYDGWVVHDRLWDASRMDALLAARDSVVVAGTVENQRAFYDRFDFVVLLSAPVEVLIARVAERTNNPYGRSVADQAEIRRYVAEVEPLLRRGATVELDARRPLDELVEAIEGMLGAG